MTIRIRQSHRVSVALGRPRPPVPGGDDLHPAENVEKMHDGMPLTDVGGRPAEIAADNSGGIYFLAKEPSDFCCLILAGGSPLNSAGDRR